MFFYKWHMSRKKKIKSYHRIGRTPYPSVCNSSYSLCLQQHIYTDQYLFLTTYNYIQDKKWHIIEPKQIVLKCKALGVRVR